MQVTSKIQNQPITKPSNCLFLGNIGSIKENQLKEILMQFGTIVKLKLFLDPKTRQSKGCGVVEYESEESNNKCIEYFKTHEFLGRKIRIEYSTSVRPRQESSSNYAKNQQSYNNNEYKSNKQNYPQTYSDLHHPDSQNSITHARLYPIDFDFELDHLDYILAENSPSFPDALKVQKLEHLIQWATDMINSMNKKHNEIAGNSDSFEESDS